jgi:1-acyl-sn-glycerol-3-phosphate acyltransferase
MCQHRRGTAADDVFRHSIGQRLARALLRLAGWRLAYRAPPGPKGVIVVYPHTSNWDFPVGMLYKLGVGLPVHWMGKDTIFRWPVRWLFQRLGGIPVNRREHTGFVESMLAAFAARDWMWLVLAPEGTRSYTDYWKSGFYRIAVAGRLPIGLGYIDWSTRTVGVDTYLELSGDMAADMHRFAEFYAGKRGRRPALAGPVRLRP